MRVAILDAMVSMLSAALPDDVPVAALPVASLAKELTALRQAAVWVVYLEGEFETPVNRDRAAMYSFCVTVGVRHYGTMQDLGREALDLATQVDQALSGQLTGVEGAGTLMLTHDGLLEPPEGMPGGLVFYELVFTVEINEEMKWPS